MKYHIYFQLQHEADSIILNLLWNIPRNDKIDRNNLNITAEKVSPSINLSILRCTVDIAVHGMLLNNQVRLYKIRMAKMISVIEMRIASKLFYKGVP